MTGTGSHTGEGLGAAVKKGVGMFHVSLTPGYLALKY